MNQIIEQIEIFVTTILGAFWFFWRCFSGDAAIAATSVLGTLAYLIRKEEDNGETM